MQTKKVRKKRSLVHDLLAWTGLLLTAAVSVFGAYSANKLLNNADGRTALNPVAIEFTAPGMYAQTAQYERKVYPYSIIQGGVQSREELSANIRADNVVAEHYANFNVGKARIITAPKTRFMYVSYRLKNKIYWTAKKVQIPQGETLITDGTCEARTRCGNMVSATPMTPTSDEEPDVESFDIPQIAKLDFPQLEPFAEPGLPPLLPITPSEELPSLRPWIPTYPIGPIGPGIPPSHPRNPEDPREFLPTPEPGTMVMVLTGLAAAAVIGIRRRKQ